MELLKLSHPRIRRADAPNPFLIFRLEAKAYTGQKRPSNIYQNTEYNGSD